MITLNDLEKLDLKIAEIKSKSNSQIKLTCNGKEFVLKESFKVKKGYKIAVSIQNNKIIPLVINDSPIIPEKDIKEGSIIR
jgi:hypothetical protein